MASQQQLEFAIKAKNEASAVLKNVGTDVDTLGQKSQKSGGLVKGLAGSMGDMAKIAGGFVIGAGLLKLPSVLGGVISGASDMNESLSKVRTVFGSSAGEIESWANSAARSMGMTKSAALEASGTFGNFLQAMGATTPQATEMSKTMVQLAADLGSFNNANPTEVLLALRSGLSGESEPLRKFGVALSEAAVSAKAVQLGLSATGKELTEQQKIQARYAIIMEQTSTAQGDFARTSGGLANQTKILKSMFEDARNELGTALLPAMTSFMGAIIQVLPFVISLGTELGGKVLEAVKGVGSALADFASNHLVEPLSFLAGLAWDGLVAMGGVFANIAGLAWDALKDGAEALANLAGLVWDKIEGPLSSMATIAWSAIKDGAEALAKLPELAWDKMEGPLRSLADIGWDALKDATEAADQLLKKVGELGPSLKQVSDQNKDGVLSANDLAAAWGKVKDAFAPLMPILRPIVDDIFLVLKSTMGDVREGTRGVADALRDLGEALKPMQPALGPLKTILEGLAVVLAVSLTLALLGLVTLIKGVVIATFASLEGSIRALTLALEYVLGVFKAWGPLIGDAMGLIDTVIKANVKFWAEHIEDIERLIVNPAKILYGVGKAIATGLLDGLVDGAKAVWAEVSSWGGKIKSLKGPMDVDRRLLTPQGYAIALSLDDGLRDGFYKVVVPGVAAMAGTIKDTFDHAWNTIADLGPSAMKALYANVPDYVKRLSPAAGGDKAAAGTMSDYISQYEGGGQYGYLRVNDKTVGEAGPNGTVWDGNQYVMPWEVGNFGPGARPVYMNVTIQGSAWALNDLAYELKKLGT